MSISMNLIIGGAVLSIFWGLAHIMPVHSVIAGFGPISQDNKRILMMEWVSEGITLLFIGILVLLVIVSAGLQDPVVMLVCRVTGVMLLVMAGLSSLSGVKNPPLTMKLCPIAKTIAAILLISGTYLPIK